MIRRMALGRVTRSLAVVGAVTGVTMCMGCRGEQAQPDDSARVTVLTRTADGGLSADTMRRALEILAPAVRKACWGTNGEVARRTADAPKTAGLWVAVTVEPSGAVGSAVADEVPQLPSLKECVEREVRGYPFPKSRRATTFRPRFVYSVQ